MKETVCGIVGFLGAAIASVFGGWDASLTTLLIFMAVDYVSGVVVAAVFHASNKSDDGTLNSNAGWKGLAKKSMILVFVLVAHRLDMAMGTGYIKDGVIIAFIANELLSVIENAGLMGVPIPEPITNAIEVLKNRKPPDSQKSM